jgi:hypothetical protein
MESAPNSSFSPRSLRRPKELRSNHKAAGQALSVSVREWGRVA